MVERNGETIAQRWTTGDALIPVPRMAGEDGPVTLIVEGWTLRAYLVKPRAAAVQARLREEAVVSRRAATA